MTEKNYIINQKRWCQRNNITVGSLVWITTKANGGGWKDNWVKEMGETLNELAKVVSIDSSGGINAEIINGAEDLDNWHYHYKSLKPVF